MKDLFKTKRARVAARIFISLVAMATLVVATMAWFASNHTNDASGMDATVEVLGNLVIAKTEAEILAMDTPVGHMAVSFEGTSTLRPAQHEPTLATGSTCSPSKNTYLEYNSNPTAVSMTTGKAADPEISLQFSDVSNSSSTKSKYCIDYTVYISATNAAIENQKLTAKISTTSTTASHQARTVDFYVNGKFMGSQNIVNGNTALTLYTGDIPYNKAASGSKYITIIMRSYYDGGLVDVSTNNTYINTASVDTSTANLAVKFEASDNS